MDRIDRLEAEAQAARDSAMANSQAIAEALDPANWFRPVRDAGRNAARTVERLAREHPAALGAAALGLVALFAASRPRTRRAVTGWRPVRAVGAAGRAARTGVDHARADVAHAASVAAERVSDLAHVTRDRAGDAAHTAGQYAQDLARAAAQRAEAALRAARHGAEDLGGRARSSARWAAHEAEEHPGAVVAAGLALGAALALLVRGTDAPQA